jgi:hypothetical protein
MIAAELSSGLDGLRVAAIALFKRDGYSLGTPNQDVVDALKWKPTCSLSSSGHIHTLVEMSEDKVYPQILRLRHAELTQFPEPVAVYVVCPEEIAIEPSSQSDIKDLESHGYGLVVVDATGKAHRRFAAIPIVQVISTLDYVAATKSLPKRVKQSVAQAFVDYRAKPTVGVVTLSEIVEGLATRAVTDAVKKGWITNGVAKGAIANALDEMYTSKDCRSSRAAIGGIRNYVANFRNPSHHWPKNKKKAHEKYSQSRHAFLEGLRLLREFPGAMKNIGLSGLLPPT